MPSLIKYLADAAPLPPDELQQVFAAITTTSLAKGALFGRAGERATQLGYLESGLVKLHGEDARGTPFVAAFAGPGEIISDYASMVQGIPARLSIETLEDSVVSTLSFADYRRLVNEFPGLHALSRHLLEDLVVKLTQRQFEFLTMNAKERYLEFMGRRRDIAGRISRNDLAAHLGITPVSLSRIRAQVIRERQGQS